MATHSSVLAWRIPGTGEPGGLPSMGSRRVGHDWSDLAAAAAALPYDTQHYDLIYLCIYQGFLGSSADKESTCNAGDPGSIPGLGRSPGEGKGYPHYSVLTWRIPWTIQSMGPQKVGHDWETFIFRPSRTLSLSRKNNHVHLLRPQNISKQNSPLTQEIEDILWHNNKRKGGERDATNDRHIHNNLYYEYICIFISQQALQSYRWAN